jgi:hypothetical protein
MTGFMDRSMSRIIVHATTTTTPTGTTPTGPNMVKGIVSLARIT